MRQRDLVVHDGGQRGQAFSVAHFAEAIGAGETTLAHLLPRAPAHPSIGSGSCPWLAGHIDLQGSAFSRFPVVVA
jgi:hypothetical protein